MKKNYSLGKQLSISERKNIIGGYVNPGGGGACIGEGPQQYQHSCTDGEGGNTGQTVCCRGVAGGEMSNGVFCVTLPLMINLYVYCNGQGPQ